MAFNFLDSQRTSSIDFGAEIGQAEDYAKQVTDNKMSELASYSNNVNSILNNVSTFNLSEKMQNISLDQAYSLGVSQLKATGDIDLEASIAGALPLISTVFKLPSALSAIKSGVQSLYEYATTPVGQTAAVSEEALPIPVEAQQALGEPASVAEQSGQELGQINTQTVTNPVFEGAEAVPEGLPSATVGEPTTAMVEPATTSIEEDIAPVETTAETTGVEAGVETGAEVAGGELAAEAGLLAVPGLGEIAGGALAIYGIVSAFKDFFGADNTAPPPPPPPIEQAPLQELPSYFTSSSQIANINQSIQSGI